MTPKSMTPASLTWSGVTARRMARHALTEPGTDLDPAGIAGVLCGAHAKVLSAAELSIGRRIAGATRADVQRALWEDRTLAKTFGPRGTVHLLSTTDLPMWTGALSALPSSVPAHPEPVRFTAEQADEVIAAIGEALADAELTVDELTEAIVDRTGPWAGEQTMEAFGGRWPRWRQLTSTAAHRGMLCFGPDRGRNVTYTNPQRWLPGFRPDDGDKDPLAGAARPVSGGWPATCQLVLLSSYRLIMFDWATSRTTPPGVTVEREIAFLELMHTHLHADHAADENSPSLTCSRAGQPVRP